MSLTRGTVYSHTLFFSLTLLLFSYPIHPVSLTLIFTPLLNFLLKNVLSGRGLVKVVRNSTYKVGWKEWGTNNQSMMCIQACTIWLYLVMFTGCLTLHSCIDIKPIKQKSFFFLRMIYDAYNKARRYIIMMRMTKNLLKTASGHLIIGCLFYRKEVWDA